MRDPKRIYNFCNKFATLWAEKIPDWRFGQTISNFFGWVYSEKKRDIFFIEEDQMLEYFEEYCGKYGMKE